MKLAKPSFSHRSSNQRMVTRLPNHWCEASWKIELRAAQQVRVARREGEQHRRFVQEGGARMLHAAVGELGDQHQVVLGERDSAARTPSRSSASAARFRRSTSGACSRARSSCERRTNRRTGSPAQRDRLERPGREGEEVGGDRLGLGKARAAGRLLQGGRVGYRAPVRRHVQLEREARLQVGLVEAGEHAARVCRDEQRIHVARRRPRGRGTG